MRQFCQPETRSKKSLVSEPNTTFKSTPCSFRGNEVHIHRVHLLMPDTAECISFIIKKQLGCINIFDFAELASLSFSMATSLHITATNCQWISLKLAVEVCMCTNKCAETNSLTHLQILFSPVDDKGFQVVLSQEVDILGILLGGEDGWFQLLFSCLLGYEHDMQWWLK